MSKRHAAYLLSLPERVVRSASALAGGLIREVGEATLPRGIREGRLYTNLVEMTLRFLIEQVGEVEGAYPGEDELDQEFLARKTAGGGLEMIGILAFRASPVWILAALADISGAGRSLLKDITKALKEAELLDPDTEFQTVEEILDGLEQTAGHAAETINAPPLDVAGLREEWATLRQNLGKVPPQRLPPIDVLTGTWGAIKAEAKRQKRSTFEMSSVMALSVVASLPEKVYWLSRLAFLSGERASHMFAAPILDHYSNTLGEIRASGFLNYWKQQFRPYLQGAAAQFQPTRRSSTQRLLDRTAGE